MIIEGKNSGIKVLAVAGKFRYYLFSVKVHVFSLMSGNSSFWWQHVTSSKTKMNLTTFELKK